MVKKKKPPAFAGGFDRVEKAEPVAAGASGITGW